MNDELRWLWKKVTLAYLTCYFSIFNAKIRILIDSSGWELVARLTTLLYKNVVTKSKDVKQDAIWQNLLRKAMAQKGQFCNRRCCCCCCCW
jgi:hypothetical protein